MSIFEAKTASDVFAYRNTRNSRGHFHKVDIVHQYKTPLITSILNNNEEVFEALLACGANPLYRPAFRTPAIYAIKIGNLNMLKKLITKDTINNKQLLERPLNTASRKGHIDIIQWLIENNATLNDNDIFTPFYLACYNNNLDAAKVLVDSGCETDFLYSSPLIASVDAGHHEIVEYLLSNDFDFDNREEAYSLACLNRDSRMTEIFRSYDVPEDELGDEEMNFLQRGLEATS